MAAMKRFTTDAPQDNIETALNLFYIKDHETWVRGGGPAPDFKDVSLFDFTRSLIKAHIPTVEIPQNDNDFSSMMAEWLFDDADSAEGTIATLYTAAWAYAELRHRLMAYEDTGLEPEKIEQMKARLPLHNWAEETPDKLSIFGATVAHIQELLKAEREGRLVVLPCKVGETVYTRNHHGRIVDGTVESIHQNFVAGKPGRWVVTVYFPEYNGTAESGLHPDFLPMNMYYGLEDFGATVFTSYEDARVEPKGGNHEA